MNGHKLIGIPSISFAGDIPTEVRHERFTSSRVHSRSGPCSTSRPHDNGITLGALSFIVLCVLSDLSINRPSYSDESLAEGVAQDAGEICLLAISPSHSKPLGILECEAVPLAATSCPKQRNDGKGVSDGVGHRETVGT